MITVSDEFKTAVYSPSRKTNAKAIFQILDVTASDDASAVVTGESAISRKTQLFDDLSDMSVKYATFEDNYWKLDGTFLLPPKPDEPDFEVGWWSNALCDANGVFDPEQIVTVNFTENHSSVGLTITFDTLAHEYAKAFNIAFYDSGNNLLYTKTAVDNDKAIYVLDYTVTDYRKVVLTISKWANGYRRARITKIDFGVVRTYTGDEIIDLNVLEEIDPISNTITSNELKITLDNQDKDFNLLNPTGAYAGLQRRQKFYNYIGVEKENGVPEYVPMGVYYLKEWRSNQGALTATFTARDIIDLLSQDEFSGAGYTNETLYNMTTDILNDYGLADYEIDTALQNITVSGTIEKMSYRDALQLIAIAGMAVIHSDREGKLRIKQLSDMVLNETINFDHMYRSPKITLDTLVNTIYIDNGSDIYTYIDPDKPSGEETLSITVKNSLIASAAHAQNVAQWILNAYKKRFEYEVNWRQNPALEVGDIVTIEDEFGQNLSVRITKNEFSYNGYLEGKTNGKGGDA